MQPPAEMVHWLFAVGIRLVQVREKELPDGELLAAADAVGRLVGTEMRLQRAENLRDLLLSAPAGPGVTRRDAERIPALRGRGVPALYQSSNSCSNYPQSVGQNSDQIGERSV